MKGGDKHLRLVFTSYSIARCEHYDDNNIFERNGVSL